ncbi:MAG: neutral zinc metallopeptidase [Verrucomicrobiota bacterium]
MKLDDLPESSQVEDRRGRGGGGLVLGGGLGTLVLLIVVMLMGGDPRALLEMAGQPNPSQAERGEYQPTPEEERAAQFVRKVLGSTEVMWAEEFHRMGKVYEKPKLVLFTDSVRSGCGMAGAQVGPFYCPADRTVYIDLSFFNELSRRFGAPGDFAQAYVIAHEVGHHVQNLLGISRQLDQQRGRISESEMNRLSVRLELQADFFAGMWGRKTQEKFQFLEEGDIGEALNAASAIGDDTLQREAQGRVVPDAFTHGTSAQRVKWFRKGFESGDIRQADTFRVSESEL